MVHCAIFTAFHHPKLPGSDGITGRGWTGQSLRNRCPGSSKVGTAQSGIVDFTEMGRRWNKIVKHIQTSRICYLFTYCSLEYDGRFARCKLDVNNPEESADQNISYTAMAWIVYRFLLICIE